MLIFEHTLEFDKWLLDLRDSIAKARISTRLVAAQQGHFGDCKPVGDGVNEMRVHCGPGYRIYFTRKGDVVYVLLIGGDKDSQKRDIAQAKALAARLKE